MARAWEADPSALFERRLGRSAEELGNSDGNDECPDIWQLDNGDVAVISRDLTAVYCTHLPHGVNLAPDERLVVVPGNILSVAKKDILHA
ncbi:hypothetical protein [Streptomyces rapamycinicus]|uniref:Uncharacterized protein n=2 Tax=Streptomyces rapamycinicus TaxID=1226757 RepID=A0A3L8RQ32_STRRN|nr:hypothetical protein [Streptomyces rapamycinicus]MBB4782531.1 hypothetical protein [Streptomyces rapamycinicus]RLV81986.1 hypothetical protein D3C57_126415 [Streptomyces rapamycinicus NRRL 5491]UTO63032.1 hypothetical protein LJB45_12345 [Streptomyces rapamycinicus]UTP30991.1 hypothetical protein LIV37_17460 [Streptomyces rapamycinicus NRRL 5491]